MYFASKISWVIQIQAKKSIFFFEFEFFGGEKPKKLVQLVPLPFVLLVLQSFFSSKNNFCSSVNNFREHARTGRIFEKFQSNDVAMRFFFIQRKPRPHFAYEFDFIHKIFRSYYAYTFIHLRVMKLYIYVSIWFNTSLRFWR